MTIYPAGGLVDWGGARPCGGGGKQQGRSKRMGGRKTVTYVVDTKAGAAGFAASQRCLGEKLAGVIFGCTTDTFKECIKDRVFGLPRSHMLYVRDIEPGLPLFLFNYSGRTLHGVFRSTSDGALNIKPHGWTGGTTAPTQFPAQVRVEVYRQCAPILETKFRSIIKSNYVSDDRHFVFELDTVQVRELCKLFKCEVPKNSNAQNLLRQIQPVHVKPRIPLQTSDTSSKSAWPAKKSPGCPSRGASTAQEDKRNKQGRGVLNLDDFPALGGPQASIKVCFYILTDSYSCFNLLYMINSSNKYRTEITKPYYLLLQLLSKAFPTFSNLQTDLPLPAYGKCVS